MGEAEVYTAAKDWAKHSAMLAGSSLSSPEVSVRGPTEGRPIFLFRI